MESSTPESPSSISPSARDPAANGWPATLSTTSWSTRRGLAVADWVEQGRWLGALGRASGWWLGDWLRYGNARYGDKYSAAAKATGYDVQSLMNMAYVAGRFEISRRRENLSFSHHAELAGQPTEDQELWLDRSVVSRLSVRALRAELREGRRRAASRAEGEARAAAKLAPDPAITPTPSTGRDADIKSPPLTGTADGRREPGGPGPTDGRARGHDADPMRVCPHCGHPWPAETASRADAARRRAPGLDVARALPDGSARA